MPDAGSRMPGPDAGTVDLAGSGRDAGDGGDGRLEELQAVDAGPHRSIRVGAETGLGGVLGVRHEPHDVARLVRDAGDVAQRAVRVHARVAEGDEVLSLETVQRLLRGDVAALA